ncbi:MAG: hypothetical protein KUG71_09955 [Porticoccaceae bacterium]|nr:hypothetical protein [Porticoccaceae bacterium]
MSETELILIMQSKELMSLGEREISLLAQQARNRNMKIYLRPRQGGIFVGLALQKIPIEQSIIEKMFHFLPAVKKYSGMVPKTLLDLVNFSGGVRKTIIGLNSAIRLRSTWSWGGDEADHLEVLIYVLNLCITACSLEDKKTENLEHPFCALCWRERSHASKKYCRHHATDRELRQRDKRKTEQILRRLDDNLIIGNGVGPRNLISLYANKNLTNPVKFLTYATNQEINEMWLHDWRSLGLLILKFIQNCYPYAYKAIKNIKPTDSLDWISWLRKIRWFLDQDDADKNILGEWLEFHNSIDDRLILLTVIQRFEAYQIIHTTKCLKPGPEPGQVPKNEFVREKVFFLANKQQQESGKTNAAAIARDVGLSRQRVAKLLKEIM